MSVSVSIRLSSSLPLCEESFRKWEVERDIGLCRNCEVGINWRSIHFNCKSAIWTHNLDLRSSQHFRPVMDFMFMYVYVCANIYIYIYIYKFIKSIYICSCMYISSNCSLTTQTTLCDNIPLATPSSFVHAWTWHFQSTIVGYMHAWILLSIGLPRPFHFKIPFGPKWALPN